MSLWHLTFNYINQYKLEKKLNSETYKFLTLWELLFFNFLVPIKILFYPLRDYYKNKGEFKLFLEFSLFLSLSLNIDI